MNIDFNVKDDTIAFGDVPVGEVFVYNDIFNDTIYIKTDTIPFKTGSIAYLGTDKVNAINARTGLHAYFDDTYRVKWRKHVKLTVE